jgi:hypothetical protein
VVDGELDSLSTLIASNDGLDLYADWDGEFLYLAADPVTSTSGYDHFVIVGVGLSTPVASPWAKAGTVADRTLFIGNEDSNNWCGWFDSGENVLSGGVECVSGTYLEGTVRLADYLGEPLPAGVYLAMAGYNSPDGGALTVQAPEGDGDGNMDSGEYVYLPLLTAGVPGGPGDGRDPGAVLHPAAPNPTVGKTTIRYTVSASAPVQLEVYDISGRRVRDLCPLAFAAGSHSIEWDGCNAAGESVAPGLYFVVLRTARDAQTRKLVVLR